MCGRFAQYQAEEVLTEHFSITDLDAPVTPRYNIAPQQDVPVVRPGAEADGEQGWELAGLRWGLLPFWVDDPAEFKANLINARSETAHEKPAFRAAFSRRRCLVPAGGFYEWREEQGGKQPYFIRPVQDVPLGFAGLWERWEPEEGGAGDTVESFTILTTDANELIAPLHDRMPVVLDPDDYSRWLNPGAGTDELRELLAPAPPETLRAYPVTRKVGNPKFDTERCIEPEGPDLSEQAETETGQTDPATGEQQKLL